jgi:hypothetical protein
VDLPAEQRGHVTRIVNRLSADQASDLGPSTKLPLQYAFLRFAQTVPLPGFHELSPCEDITL